MMNFYFATFLEIFATLSIVNKENNLSVILFALNYF